jgi:hypothetical protein
MGGSYKRRRTQVTPSNGTYHNPQAENIRDSDSDDSSTGRDWKGYAIDLGREIRLLRETVEALCKGDMVT